MSEKRNSYWDAYELLKGAVPNLIKTKINIKERRKDSNNDSEKSMEDEREVSDLSLTQRINLNLLKYKEIKLVCDKTGIQPAILLYILLVCLVFILIGYLQNYLTVLIATLYPMYISIKTLQNPESTKENVTQWLTYWVVYSVFNNLESILGVLLETIPFYFFMKIMFLLYLFLPQFNGATKIYEKLLKHLFNKYEGHITDFSMKIVRKLTVAIEEGREKLQIEDEINIVQNIIRE